MAILNKLTAKYPISGGKVPKGVTLQVVSQSVIPTAKEIANAIKCQLGVEVPAGNCSCGNFTIERIRSMTMQDQFCNECGLSYDVPHLVAEWLLGEEYLHRIERRYEQMRNGYDYPYTEWQKIFTEDLKPFNGYSDTTSVTIPVGNTQLGTDIKALHKGAIGVDLPTWFNIQDNKHIMIVAQDPLRNSKWYGECYDAVISSPFGQQDSEHRQRANGGKMMSLLVRQLVNSSYGVYLTDASKFFIHDHKTTDMFSAAHMDMYAEIMRREIEFVKPAIIVCLGRRAEILCKKIGLSNVLALPHLSGTARGAITRRFPKLESIGATAENIAKEYAKEIVAKIQ